MRLRILLAGSIFAGLAMGAPANAQQANTPAFRVPLSRTGGISAGSPIWAWMQSVSQCSSTCGSGTRATGYVCQNVSDYDYSGAGYGTAEADASCISGNAGPKPAGTSASCTDYSGCSYSWIKPTVVATPVGQNGNPAGTLTCGYVHSVYSPYCKRSDGTVLAGGDYKFCQSSIGYNVNPSVPDTLGYDRIAPVTTSCVTSDYQWQVGTTAIAPGDTTTGWGSWSDTCSNAATHTRSVTCYRKFDNTAVADSNCAAPIPAKSQTQGVYSTCSFQWSPGAWGASASTCATGTTQTRTVACQRNSATGHAWETDPTAADCTAAKPAATQTLNDYSGCSYSWQTGGWGATASTCSNSSPQTRTVTCLRSNGDTVADSSCTAAKPAASQNVSNYSGCSYSWQTGGWSDWNSHCSGSAVQTRSVTCYRSTGDAVADSDCTSRGLGKPTATNGPAGVYDACTYYGGPWWGDWTYSSTCSATAQATQHRTCYRSDGTPMGTGDPCVNSGVPVSQTITTANYSSCSYAWVATGWTDWNSHCSPSAVQTRSVYCRRSDGTAVADSSCAGAKPTTTNGPAAVYDQCGGAWAIGGWSDWNSHCSANATQTRNVYCYQNGTGTTEADSFCNSTGAGATPARSQSGAVYDGCGYAAVNFGSWSACSNSSQTSTGQCQRSDGAIVSSDNCTNRGVAVTKTQSCSSGCSNPYSAYMTNALNQICTGNVRYLSTQDADANLVWKNGAAWYISRHPGIKCFGYVDMEPQGGSQADSAGGAYVVSDGATAPHAPIYNMGSPGYPYPATTGEQWGMVGAPGAWNFQVLSACNN